MICAYFVRQPPSRDATWLDRRVEGVLSRMIRFYDRTLSFALDHRPLMLIVFAATIALTVGLYIKVPKGYFPQDDTGLIFGGTEASTDISFEAMKAIAAEGHGCCACRSGGGRAWILGRRFAVQCFGQSRASVHQPQADEPARRYQYTAGGGAAARPSSTRFPAFAYSWYAAQDLRAGGRQSNSQYQFTLWSADIDELQKWVPRVVDRVKQVPGIVDVTTDREQGGLQANVTINREAAARFGVRVQDIDNALNNAFSQRQISTIYGPRNQYRVILEVDRTYQRDPTDLTRVYVPGTGDAQVPLSAVTQTERGIAPLVVNHQGQFPSVTITYNLAPNAAIEDATAALEQAVAEMHIPDNDSRRFLRRCAGLQAERSVRSRCCCWRR